MPYKDKAKQKEAQRNHYLTNKSKYRKNAKKTHNKTAALIAEYKKKAGCLNCGVNHPAILDFHHLDSDTKEISIAQISRNKSAWASVEKELYKCIVLCANCHRLIHYYHRNPEAN